MEIFWYSISLVLVHSRHPANRTNLQIIAWVEQTEPLRGERFYEFFLLILYWDTPLHPSTHLVTYTDAEKERNPMETRGMWTFCYRACHRQFTLQLNHISSEILLPDFWTNHLCTWLCSMKRELLGKGEALPEDSGRRWVLLEEGRIQKRGSICNGASIKVEES